MTNNKLLPNITKNNILLLIISASLLWLMSAPALATEQVEAPLSCDDNCAQNLWAWADEFQIPAEVFPRDKAQLLTLHVLDLSHNKWAIRHNDTRDNPLPKITYLPPEIGQLSQLRKLILDNNQLSTLPAEIGQLSQLQGLAVNNNQLSVLPPEIGQLNQLKILLVYLNKLKSLPAEIGQLSQLEHLWVSENQLSALPAEIGQLSQLQALQVGINQLSALPAEIGQLKQLQTINIYNNQLRTLPASITRLTMLSSIDLRDNLALNLSPEQEAFIRTIDRVWR